ncbi:hypothetical protein PI124_g19148 [Phytophthora idaei]|nr:hypothetical protein PI125_g18206 [Phytophthora idaei]KAG3138508.1 hypothetical protein PI126_g16880 [Phytophthora idaei]KAG3235829.1 hypothetical protein PI124_g19148 [Phytophthora idaei]
MWLDNVVLVADNTPCHTNIEDVFKEEPFANAKFLFGTIFPMLNSIENCLSTFKAMVKRYIARLRKAILQAPQHRTNKAHREEYLKLAADLLVREAITPYLCYKCSLHCQFSCTGLQTKDMPVGE